MLARLKQFLKWAQYFYMILSANILSRTFWPWVDSQSKTVCKQFMIGFYHTNIYFHLMNSMVSKSIYIFMIISRSGTTRLIDPFSIPLNKIQLLSKVQYVHEFFFFFSECDKCGELEKDNLVEWTSNGDFGWATASRFN